VADARLFEGGRDGPDLALGAGDLGGDRAQNLESRRVDAVVIGDENTHETLCRAADPGSVCV
jgi:uncharacterized protein YjlB